VDGLVVFPNYSYSLYNPNVIVWILFRVPLCFSHRFAVTEFGAEALKLISHVVGFSNFYIPKHSLWFYLRH